MELNTFRDEALPFGADASGIVLDDDDDVGATTVKTVAVFFDIGCLRRSYYIITDMLFPELAPVLRRAAYLFPDDALGRFLKGKHKVREHSLQRIQEVREELSRHSTGHTCGESAQHITGQAGSLAVDCKDIKLPKPV